MNYKGSFRPPAVNVTSSPIKIAGPGRFNISKDGIEIVGYQADGRTRLEAALVLMLLALAAGALALAAETILTAVPPLVLQLAGGALGGLIYFAIIAGREKHQADKPVEMVIPWPAVGAATRDLRHPGGIVVEVNDSRAKGTLHFHPTDGVNDFLTAIRSRP